MNKKWIYSFGNGKAEGNASMRDILGGKGANLAEVCNLNLLVPPGFTISSEICTYYYENNKTFPLDLESQINKYLHEIESQLDKKFGDHKNPLLVSVRSGARASMPGMMDTILNLGLNDETVVGLASTSSNERFAYDSYRRFIQMYSDVVLGIEYYHFEECLDLVKQDRDIIIDSELSIEDLKYLITQYKEIVLDKSGYEFPQNVKEQLMSAIKAVFDSWMCSRAITYRKLNSIPESWGTAVNVQSMVFGNMGNTSATGVVFTRNPSNGLKELYGEYLLNAQGEDIVAGIRVPNSITKQGRVGTDSDNLSMEEIMPEIYKELCSVAQKLELHYKDMQDIEFTIEQGKLYILQTRSGKRTIQSALNIAVDMVSEKLIDKNDALTRINAESLIQLLHPTLDKTVEKKVILKGLPASPGASSGIVAFSSADAERFFEMGNNNIILVRMETSPEDIGGMHVSKGILTSRGGMTSHAAVVARGMGKPCIVGASALNINLASKKMIIGDIEIKEGEYITIDGSSGEVILGQVPTIKPTVSGAFSQIMQWADEAKLLTVRANAETVHDIKTALDFEAEGIGLCRTEHMFFDAERIIAVRKMIIARNFNEREKALQELLPAQKKDFIEIFSLMKDKPVNIRLLDMPLHEFLPTNDEEMQDVATSANVDLELVKFRCKQLHEVNPMLGHRGSRLGITYPEIYEMQVRAICEAMVEVNAANSFVTKVEIMVPLIATAKEMQILRALIEKVIMKVERETNTKLQHQIGTMIELPRAALRSDDIAEFAEYMSYGTNDLSQTSFGLSRDDSATFMHEYIEKGIFSNDPFVELDVNGVGELIKISAEKARKVKKDIKLGVCGEHGGNPASINFFNSIGLSYISCSPYRIPVARLAAAQAAINEKKTQKKTLKIELAVG